MENKNRVCIVGKSDDPELTVQLELPTRINPKVRTVYMPSHEKRMGYKFGRTDSSKKAIVTIEGDAIEELTAL